MKKILISMLFVFAMILSGCSFNQPNEKEEQNNVKDEEKTDNQEKDTKDVNNENLLETKYYTLTLPDKWKDLYDWEMRSTSNNQYALNFYEKQSHEEIEGGFLFGITLYLEGEDYSYLPSYDVMGTLKVNNKNYTVLVEYPTDVQFTEETSDAYHELSKDTDEILQSFQAKEGYTFEKNK